MEIRGFTGEGAWYRGNLHSHTTNSDGLLNPQQMTKSYRKKGYSFICISDHDFYTDYRGELDRDDFKILPGYEASALLFEDDTYRHCLKVHHMNAILGTTDMQGQASKKRPEHGTHLPVRRYFGSWDGAAVAREMADELTGMGFIVSYNHPVWSRVRMDEFIYTDNIFAVEVFNYGTVNECGMGYDTYCWDTMLREGRRILGVAADDNHCVKKYNDTFGGYIVVRAEQLTHDDIISNIMRGNYYSSSGPEIYDWGISGETVYVECSKVNRINFIAGNMLADGATVMGRTQKDVIHGASHRLKGHESYVRVECTDRHGRTAWTNPIFID